MQSGALLSTAKMLKSNKRSRAPSLFAESKDHLDWSRYEAHMKSFKHWMTKLDNEERPTGAHTPDGNIIKIESTVRNILAFASMRLEWGDTPTFEWLLEQDYFEELYQGYKKEQLDERGNDLTYIGKQLVDSTWAIQWAGMQTWETQAPGWQRVDPENNPNHWEWIDEQVWTMHPADLERLVAKVHNLGTQLRARGNKQNKIATELASIAQANQPKPNPISIRVTINRLEEELTTKLKECDTDLIHDSDKLAVAELLILKMLSPGGRPIQLHQVIVALNEESMHEIAKGAIDGHAVLIRGGLDRDPTFFVFVKGRFVHYALSDVSDLLNLFWKCFPHIGNGDIMFTPSMHGTRFTRCKDHTKFGNAGRFGDYVEIITRELLGESMRPKTLRQLNATLMQDIGSSHEVQESHAALVGTSVRHLKDTYSQRSLIESSHLASEVQRHQSNPLFDATQHNVVVPVITKFGVEPSVVRLVRRTLESDLYAVFIHEHGHVELSQQLIRVAAKWREELPRAQLMMDEAAYLQVWRSSHESSRAANATFEALSMNTQQFAFESMVVQPLELMPKDMVYVMHACALAEVKAASGDNEVEVALATELLDAPGRSTSKTFFRFERNAKAIVVARSAVRFPIDVTFNKKEGVFQVVKCHGMNTV